MAVALVHLNFIFFLDSLVGLPVHISTLVLHTHTYHFSLNLSGPSRDWLEFTHKFYTREWLGHTTDTGNVKSLTYRRL